MSKPDFSNGLYVRGKRDSRYKLGDLSYAMNFHLESANHSLLDYDLVINPKKGKCFDSYQIYRHPDPLKRVYCFSTIHYYKYLEKIK